MPWEVVTRLLVPESAAWVLHNHVMTNIEPKETNDGWQAIKQFKNS